MIAGVTFVLDYEMARKTKKKHWSESLTDPGIDV